MTPRLPVARAILLAASCCAACHASGSTEAWGKPAQRLPGEHADVQTLNLHYERTRSQVLVRAISRPTRATLDYAAYHANFMIDEAEPESAPAPRAKVELAHPFDGSVEAPTLTADVLATPLTPEERRRPLAFAPLVDYLMAKKLPGAQKLEDFEASVSSEHWQGTGVAGAPSQTISEGFLHRTPSGAVELWVKIEFARWFERLGPLSDQDGDGFPELYGRARAGILGAEIVSAIERDYIGHVFDAKEVRAWANQLSSYWYPSYNTDLVPAAAVFPDEHTEAEIKAELAGRTFERPTIVLRGKPQGKPTYEVFIVGGLANANDSVIAPAVELASSRPTPNAAAIAASIQSELERAGGSWETWFETLAPFHAAVRKRLSGTPRKIKALAGNDGFLFFRNSLESTIAGDLERQPEGKNPLPAIMEFKRALEAQGVDFLFVPVPSKVEVYPEAFDRKFASSVGQIVNPYGRKFLLRLAEQGVEVVDLLSSMLAARSAPATAASEPLYQHQDTHWTALGLELAAERISARIKQYPWYADLARHQRRFTLKDASFTRFGDLHSRLQEGSKKNYQPETLSAHQVLNQDGTPYEDDPESPVVVLGDSFTGVYQLMDAEHAGLSAHVAHAIGYPVDLVMSYGGGPNVRNKLMRRGADALAHKKVVIWVMAARDLYAYWENWEPLKGP